MICSFISILNDSLRNRKKLYIYYLYQCCLVTRFDFGPYVFKPRHWFFFFRIMATLIDMLFTLKWNVGDIFSNCLVVLKIHKIQQITLQVLITASNRRKKIEKKKSIKEVKMYWSKDKYTRWLHQQKILSLLTYDIIK